VFFRDELGVVGLNVRRVHKHDAAKVVRGGSAINRAGVTLLDEIGQVACVINVRVAQDHGVNLLRIEREIAVAAGHLFAMALKESAFEEKAFAVDFKKVHGAGRSSGGSKEVNAHRESVMRGA
jgi:hypothetical protein